MKKAVIFDMDGVLTDSEQAYFRMKTDFFKTISANPLSFTLDNIAGRSEDEAWQIMFPDPDVRAETRRRFVEYRDAREIDYSKIVFPDAKEVLSYLKTRGTILALASAGPMDGIDRFIRQCNLKGYFTAVISGETLAANKPDPLIYKMALQKIRLPAQSVIAVEDSPTGIKAAKMAGISTWARKPVGYSQDQSLADRKIVNLLELKRLF